MSCVDQGHHMASQNLTGVHRTSHSPTSFIFSHSHFRSLGGLLILGVSCFLVIPLSNPPCIIFSTWVITRFRALTFPIMSELVTSELEAYLSCEGGVITFCPPRGPAFAFTFFLLNSCSLCSHFQLVFFFFFIKLFTIKV